MPGPTSSITVPLYKVMIDGMEISPEEADAVHSIKITDWLRLPDVCTLDVGYQADVQGPAFSRLDGSRFKIGAALEVKLGSTDERTTKTIFKGEIVTVEPDFQAGSVALSVRAYDKSHRMMRSRKQRSFLNKTISDIVKEVCGGYGLGASTGPTGAPLDFVLQNNETDWEFVWRLARRVGFEVTLEENTIHFKKPAAATEIALDYPDEIHSFRPRVTAVQQVNKVNVRGFDSKQKRSVLATKTRAEQLTEAGIKRSEVAKAFGDSVLEIAGQSFSSNEEAGAIAQAALDQLANAYLAAEGATFGNPDIKAGVKLKITGVGEKFSGTYRVAKAVHVLQTGGYITQFANSAGEHTLLGQTGSNGGGGSPGGGNSLVVGVVTNNNDPEKLGRVKVKLPFLSEQETFWAPVLLPSSGNERGISMLPQPDEQVIVGFENGDPSYPIVLGSVFNGKDKPGSEMAVLDGSFALKSDKKALIAAKEDINLRSDKGKWLIDVKGGEIVENVKTPGNYKGTFDGKYELTASQAVTIESKMSITLKAPSITIEAQGSLALKGANVDVQGQAAVNVKGAIINLG
jgi:phage protein D/phage baseplate assembly protein gpV